MVEEEGVKVGVVIFISGLVRRLTILVLVFNGTKSRFNRPKRLDS